MLAPTGVLKQCTALLHCSKATIKCNNPHPLDLLSPLSYFRCRPDIGAATVPRMVEAHGSAKRHKKRDDLATRDAAVSFVLTQRLNFGKSANWTGLVPF